MTTLLEGVDTISYRVQVEMEDVSDVEEDSKDKAKTPTPVEQGKLGPQVVDLEDIEVKSSNL